MFCPLWALLETMTAGESWVSLVPILVSMRLTGIMHDFKQSSNYNQEIAAKELLKARWTTPYTQDEPTKLYDEEITWRD